MVTIAQPGANAATPAGRAIHAGDGIAWLKANAPLPAAHSIITSLPDSSEVPSMGFARWRDWFSETSRLICESVAPGAAAVFFQTDVKREGTWVDKAYLVQRGAEAAGAAQLWHKVVCRAPAGIATFGRPAYAHLLCFSKALRLEPKHSTADVLPRLGEMPWARAMGVEACVVAVKFLAAHAGARVIVDPFCGLGTALAVANALGLGGVGVELSAKRAEKARRLEVTLPLPSQGRR